MTLSTMFWRSPIEISTKKISCMMKLCPIDQRSDFAQGFGREVSCRKRDCGRGASTNSTEMEGLMSISQHLSNVCLTEKPAKGSAHVCDPEGLWVEYVFDKQFECKNANGKRVGYW